MNGAEVLQLCRLVKACCPSQAFDEYSVDAWALILGSYDYADAKAAVAELVSLPLDPGKARYVEPGHIIGGIKRIRQKRIEQTPMPEPPSGLTVGEYITWQKHTHHAIAAGTYRDTQPPQTTHPELVAQILDIARTHTIDAEEGTHP